jgi:hypothetical protein
MLVQKIEEYPSLNLMKILLSRLFQIIYVEEKKKN